jgi:hypothetical protein
MRIAEIQNNNIIVLARWAEFLFSLPDNHSPIHVSRGQQALIIGPSHCQYWGRVSLESVHYSSRLHIKEIHTAILTPTYDTSPLQEAHKRAECTENRQRVMRDRELSLQVHIAIWQQSEQFESVISGGDEQ